MARFSMIFLFTWWYAIASAFVPVEVLRRTVHGMVPPPESSWQRKHFTRVAVSTSDRELSEVSTEDVVREIKAAEREVLKSVIKNKNLVLGIASAVMMSVAYTLVGTSHLDMHTTTQHASLMLPSLKTIPMQVWNAYESALASNPIATKGATSATVYGLGDVLSQRTAGNDKLDNGRVLRSMIAGGVGHGPLSHVWYDLSEGFFAHLGISTEWWSLVPKIIVDQTVWGPIWNSLYILMIGLMNAESFAKMKGDIQSNAVPLFLEGLKLWPLAHVVTYGLVPVENRLLWVDTVEIIWVSILATKAAQLSQTDSPPLEASTSR